jgi:hypothetical protein
VDFWTGLVVNVVVAAVLIGLAVATFAPRWGWT